MTWMMMTKPITTNIPRDVKDAVSKCRSAMQEALKNHISRMDVEFPVGTKFGVEKDAVSKKKKSNKLLPNNKKTTTTTTMNSNVVDQENLQTPETLQIHNVYNTTMHDKDDSIHDEYDTSEDENITEIEIYEHYGEKIHETEESKPTETSQVLMVFNKAIHHEDDSSDDKSVIEIEPPEVNGEQEIGNKNKLYTTNFQIQIEN